MEKYKKIDVLINNAGTCDDSYLQMMTEEKWNNVISLNLNGLFHCTKYFSRNMIKNNSGKIIKTV